MKSASTYRSAPLLLNLEAVSGKGWQVVSTWCNLGLWPPSPEAAATATFKQACESLAMVIGHAASLASGDDVLDVGVGYADQTALWVHRFGVRRVVAIEPSAAHVAHARAVQKEGRLADAVELHVGSASSLPECCGAQSGAQFDAVLCLDCAYHFRTRASFLKTAGTLLRSGGRYAAADLIVADDKDHEDGRRHNTMSSWSRAWRACARYVVALLCDIPLANLHGTAEYVSALDVAGLQVASIEKITDRVLAPFAAHADAQRRALRGQQLSFSEGCFLWIISALFAFVAKYELFDVVVVRAVRR